MKNENAAMWFAGLLFNVLAIVLADRFLIPLIEWVTKKVVQICTTF